MSASTEIPDVIGGITNAIGLNRLWQTDEQADSERRKSEQESKEEEAHRTKQKGDGHTNGDLAPVSIAQERTKEKGGRGQTDHDIEIHGVPRRRTPPPENKGKGYEWSMPRTIGKDDSEGHQTQPESTEMLPEEKDEITMESMLDGKTSKPSLSSLIPFLSQQRKQSSSALPTGPKTVPEREKENPFERPRPQSTASPENITFDRPPTKRQFTVPAPRPETADSTATHKAARSRWVTAAQGLRFPLRRKKTDRPRERSTGTEIIRTLTAGAPAASLFASHMIPDERSHHRIPVIVEFLKVTFPPFLSSWTMLIIDRYHRF